MYYSYFKIIIISVLFSHSSIIFTCNRDKFFNNIEANHSSIPVCNVSNSSFVLGPCGLRRTLSEVQVIRDNGLNARSFIPKFFNVSIPINRLMLQHARLLYALKR